MTFLRKHRVSIGYLTGAMLLSALVSELIWWAFT